ncbi:ATP synthase subunit I [Aphanothece hegewaldii CCALA 016]|uniref:ATP synthase subunit I n=1 Tax=Aphanothece hegewaldii CCALA 016 TaxID=2107694 RepID=A0A2T1LXN6_9CHRO|nr:ATP synthase subunit I [Aphanothece hegewaldii]PSF37139.1 ATP synthase subunit I [Aphanothece hegewaldii CCALA 016]
MSVSKKSPIYLKVNPSVARQFRHVIKRLAHKRFRKLLTWFLLAMGILMMLAWNWKLVISTSSGIGLMWLVYAGLDWNWRRQWKHLLPFFKGYKGKLTLAVGSGGLAAISTYLVASIWADSENRWLATGTIIQGVATLSTLILVLWQMLTVQHQSDETKFENWLSELTAQDSLKRLIAVRQLTNLVNQGGLPLSYQQQLSDYFRLMLRSEQDDSVRDALLDSLGTWNTQPSLEVGQPLQIPVSLKRSLNRVARPI